MASALSAVESTTKLLGRNSSKHPTDNTSKAKLVEKIQHLDNMSPYTEVTNSLLYTVYNKNNCSLTRRKL